VFGYVLSGMKLLTSSFRIGSILGIAIRVHVLLVLLVVIAAAWHPFGLAGALLLVLLVIVLLLHELGHCLVARKFGIRVLDITLWPLGGMARMSAMPESSRVEGLIAAAGPAVNFLLAAITVPVCLMLTTLDGASTVARDLSLYFIEMNLALGVFNLVPAFPTDGGRILRALLARDHDWVTATERAVLVSRVLAVVVGVVGAMIGNVGLILVAAWLVWMGSIELLDVRSRHSRSARETGAQPAPVMNEPPPVARQPQGRFSEDDIERLERYRGRLRPFDG
jgi:Zn-dependent protease